MWMLWRRLPRSHPPEIHPWVLSVRFKMSNAFKWLTEAEFDVGKFKSPEENGLTSPQKKIVFT